MSITEISDLLPDDANGLIIHYHANLAQCEIIGIEPNSTFWRLMTKGPTQLLKGRVLLQINGNDVHTINDAEEILDGYVLATHGRLLLSDNPHS